MEGQLKAQTARLFACPVSEGTGQEGALRWLWAVEDWALGKALAEAALAGEPSVSADGAGAGAGTASASASASELVIAEHDIVGLRGGETNARACLASVIAATSLAPTKQSDLPQDVGMHITIAVRARES